jgi:hypothetical protein
MAVGIILVLALVNFIVIMKVRSKPPMMRVWFLAGLVMLEVILVLITLLVLKNYDFYDHMVFIAALALGFVILTAGKFLILRIN